MRNDRRSRERRMVVAVASAGALLLGGAVALPAGAAAPMSAASRCTGSYKDVYSAESFNSSRTQSVAVWLQYNPTCRSVRAQVARWSDTGWEIWVYNEDTKESATQYSPGQTTSWLDDAGTHSHACVQQYGSAKACTPSY